MQFSLEFLLTLAFAASALASPQQPVSQGGDGQPVAATSVAPVTQIHDGQIQAAPTPAGVVTQIHDGQIQAPAPTTHTTTACAASQIKDGQIQASGAPCPTSNSTFTTSSPSASAFTGAAPVAGWNKEVVLAAIGAAAGFALL